MDLQENDDRERAELLAQLAERAKGTFWDYLGCVAQHVEPGKAVVTLDVQPSHLNALGIVHGGVLSSLLDNAMGLAALLARPGRHKVTTNLNVHFVAPLTSGRLSATATILHESRSTITVQGVVADESGKIGTIGTGSFRVVSS
jgi:uncharacterized protein (TIGR00369 family)